MAINVLITDDHPVFRSGLRNLLETNENIRVVGEANDGLEAIDWVKKKNPDVIVMDVSMPKLNGIDATKQILSFAPDTKVLALSIHSGKRYVKDMLNAGAVGYLLKDSAPDELISAVQKIARGEMYLSSTITSIALSNEEADEEIENVSILTTKLHRPPVTSDCVNRNLITEELEKNIYKPLSLVVAPAGYGKSVTVSQWLESTKALFTWISLDDEHNDLRTFLLYINAAIEKIFPRALENTSVLINASSLPPVNVIAYSLINELDAIEHDFILVLDDYHRIQNDTIHHLMNELLRFPPEHMHLSILTRKDPPLKINSLLLHNRMTEIRMNELSFSENEIQALFQKLFNISLKEGAAKLILEKTEGWIVGLRMALLNIKSEDDVDVAIDNIRGDAWSLSNFLVEEVLQKQPAEVQDLLLITSVFDRFCADLIEDIYSKMDKRENQLSGSEFIQWLVKSNLFVISLDAERKWFRYHHLIQELFQKRLKSQKSDEEIFPYHIRAAEWFEKHKYIEESINHMLAGNDPNGACQIVERHRWAELDDDRWYMVQGWLSLLPQELIREKPELMLSEAWGAYENFKLEKIPPLMELTIPLLKKNKKDQVLLGECYLMLGLVYHWSGIPKLALEHFQKAESLLTSNRKLAMGMLYLHIALSRSVNGEKEVALKDLKTQLSVENEDAVYITRLMAGIFYVNTFAGDLITARKESQLVQAISKKANLIYTDAMGICMEGISCLNAFELKDALNLFTIAGQQRYNLHIGVALDAIASKTIICHFLQNPAEADKSLVLLESFEKDFNPTGNLPITQSCRARLSLLRGELEPALAWESTLNESPSFAGLFVWLEVPIITQARVLIYEGSEENLKKAAGLLDKVKAVSTECHLVNQIIEIAVLQSVLMEKQGNHDEAIATLEEVLILAEPGGWIRPFVEAGPILFEMLKELQNQNIATKYINQVIRTIEKYQTLKDNVPAENKQHKKPSLTLKENMESITSRELETVTQLANGLRNKEIADRLYVSEGTVKKHIYNLCQKLEVNNRMNLVKKVKELGLINE